MPRKKEDIEDSPLRGTLALKEYLALRRQRQVDLSMSLRPVWFTKRVPEQAPKLHREALSPKPETNQTKQKEKKYVLASGAYILKLEQYRD